MQRMQHIKTGVKQLFYIEKGCIQSCIHFRLLHTVKRMQHLLRGNKLS